METVLTQDQIDLINSLSKEALQGLGIKLTTRKEKSPEDILKAQQHEAFISFMEGIGALMANGTWVCMCEEHKDKSGRRPASYNELPMIKHILKTGCKEVRLVSVELLVKHGKEALLTRKHVSMKWATDNLDRATQEAKERALKKAEEALLKAQAALK